MTRTFLLLGSFFGFTAVALGAFGAHLLKNKLPADMQQVYEIATRYHFYHALALFAVAWVCAQFPNANAAPAGWLFTAGIVIFSGSLYTLAITGQGWLGAVTPLGGLCFLAGWAWLGWTIWKTTT